MGIGSITLLTPMTKKFPWYFFKDLLEARFWVTSTILEYFQWWRKFAKCTILQKLKAWLSLVTEDNLNLYKTFINVEDIISELWNELEKKLHITSIAK